MVVLLVQVALMIQGDLQSPAFIIGYWLSTWLRGGYIAVAMLLGAMGAFFSVSMLGWYHTALFSRLSIIHGWGDTSGLSTVPMSSSLCCMHVANLVLLGIICLSG